MVTGRDRGAYWNGRARLNNPFLLRTADPPLSSVAGRLHWKAPGAALRRENHTLKRALTDPALFAGIGNAYSDELLHRARLSPVTLTSSLDDEEVARLFEATRATLVEWTDRLRREAGGQFPEKVTAFREGMAVHGRHRQPCPACGTLVQRIVRADNEVEYCPRCQTGGRILSDRSLARLLKADWPRTVEALEQHPVLSKPRPPRRPGGAG